MLQSISRWRTERSAVRISINGRALSALLVLAIVAPFATGCGSDEGPPRAAARGVVSLDGQPLVEGVIRYIPAGENKGPAAAAVIRDGKYEMTEEDGPVIGSHRVEIEATGHYGFAIDDEAAFAERVEKNGGRMARNPVPETYNRRSTLTAQISADSTNALDFNLSSQGNHTAQR
jgi:hypothetical protein